MQHLPICFQTAFLSIQRTIALSIPFIMKYGSKTQQSVAQSHIPTPHPAQNRRDNARMSLYRLLSISSPCHD